ncbi:hypothetical protein [Rossellomorea marisflavi]|uniref:hypothetical protein n=1 Tax=Rossellomorea marisflavi TaxID=189381 RepID=UPI003F9EEA5F
MKTFNWFNIFGEVLASVDYQITTVDDKTILKVGRGESFNEFVLDEVPRYDYVYKVLKRPKNTIRVKSIQRFLELLEEENDSKAAMNSIIYGLLEKVAGLEKVEVGSK